MNEENAATVAAYFVSIIKYMHKNDIILRNLRPETIYFEDPGILDFKMVDLSLAIRKGDLIDHIEDIPYEQNQRLSKAFRAPELFG